MIKEALSLLLLLIRQSEGCKLVAYPDPASKGLPWTIGWGSTGPNITEGTVWTQEQANKRLLRDAIHCIHLALLLSPNLDTPGRVAAIADFLYNFGKTRYKTSTMRRLIFQGLWGPASLEFPKWMHGGGKRMPGLVLRRHREQLLFSTS